MSTPNCETCGGHRRGDCCTCGLGLASTIDHLRALLREAADTVLASTAETGISDDRRQYRIALEQRLRAALAK